MVGGQQRFLKDVLGVFDVGARANRKRHQASPVAVDEPIERTGVVVDDGLEKLLVGQPCACIGKVKRTPVLILARGDSEVCEVAVEDMLGSFKATLEYE